MAHTAQERYSFLVDAKLRATLVKKDGIIFSTRYEGNPKAGAVKIPVRDTEVEVKEYDKVKGVTGSTGATTYLKLDINHDDAVNELIDGYDAASVPDNLVADRLDSAGYSLGLKTEGYATNCLETAATVHEDGTKLTAKNTYETIVGMRTAASKAGVPNDGKRWLLVSPDVYSLLLLDDRFTHATELGDQVIATGAVGKIAGFLVFEDTTLSETTDMIAGHPNWCHHVNEWSVPVHLQDLNGSGNFIGASAVQGRIVQGYKVSKPSTLLIRKHTS